jgi:hypothetical protein
VITWKGSNWNKYKGTDEEFAVMDFFVKGYNKELRKLWNEEV